ncbi:SDR family NAD(P)-dependent oxidoreductase [Neotabrizicola shimadae]|uniref:SDR family oxidoreductase n=1 Tax=Neotabrizicola shimadae TaxID=2807096 RepID=A0A8G1EB71_9RHOB|nr:SDR family oxidoreductase [Neotabrizicola shimadae]QYZ69087.1 SDR family oxidoreductase [Neotabrizicola shimadae]
MTDLGLNGKRVVVTGAGGGLGRAFALAFAKAGARVVAADVNADGAAETAALAGPSALSMRLDVTSAADCAALATRLSDDWGGVDVLVNNAALYGGLERRPFEDIDEDIWDRVMAVNVKGVWNMSRHLAPLMPADGSIVNVASATVFSGSPQWMHYVASKGAVIAMSRTMAKELGGREVRVNVLAPGFTMTEASLGLIENARSYGVDRAALKRPAETDDIVGGALFLASPLSSYMTGQTLIIDGGRQFI